MIGSGIGIGKGASEEQQGVGSECGGDGGKGGKWRSRRKTFTLALMTSVRKQGVS